MDDHGENRSALHHPGRLYEARADGAVARGRPEAVVDSLLAEAEEACRRGVPVQRRGENPNEEALRELYVRRHGGGEGWEACRAGLAEESQRKRKREVLSARLEDPRPVKPFALENLAGEEVRFSELEGRVVFRRRGTSPDLVRSFSWRIEALKEEAGSRTSTDR